MRNCAMIPGLHKEDGVWAYVVISPDKDSMGILGVILAIARAPLLRQGLL